MCVSVVGTNTIDDNKMWHAEFCVHVIDPSFEDKHFYFWCNEKLLFLIKYHRGNSVESNNRFFHFFEVKKRKTNTIYLVDITTLLIIDDCHRCAFYHSMVRTHTTHRLQWKLPSNLWWWHSILKERRFCLLCKYCFFIRSK